MMNPETIKKVTTFAIGLGVGGLLGALITRQAVKAKYEAYADAEIQQVKDHYKLVRKEGELSDIMNVNTSNQDDERREPPSDEMLKAHSKLVALYSESVEIDLEERSEKTINAFEESKKYESEVSKGEQPTKRDPNNPYRISIEEFMEDTDEHYDKITLNYFEEDDVLCDDRESVIDDVDGTVGIDNLNYFGDCSQNPDLLYVRNERIMTDFEICREEGSFSNMIMGISHEVLGLKEPKPKIKKMRNDE